MNQRSWKGALLTIAIIEALGFLSGFLSGSISTGYSNFTKPPLSPPGWVFGIVWVILYALMGLAFYLILTSPDPDNKKEEAIKLFLLQLALNLAWPIVFFRYELLWAAFAIIVALDVLVIMTIQSFRAVNETAAKLMIPYLVWILFATYLNLGFALLN